MSIIVREATNIFSAPHWGGWDFNVDDAVVQHCRDAFKDKYHSYWIYPVYIDDTYMHFTEDFFKEVGVELLPKISKLPHAPKHPAGRNPYNHRGYLVNPSCKNIAEWEAWRREMDEYREQVWHIVWGDYEKNRRREVKPIKIIVRAVRTPKGFEKILSVKRVKRFEVDELL